MSKTLRSRLLSSEEQLLASFTLGNVAIASFTEDWATLLFDLGAAIKLKQVDEETMTIAHVISSRVAILADSLFQLESETGKVLATVEHQASRILLHDGVEAQSCTDRPSSQPPSPPPPPPITHTLDHSVSSPTSASLHCMAHRWLLQNLHDPYPSSAEATSLAGICGCTVKTVQEWFSSARRRIGWTDLASEKFSGSRRETSLAATGAYATDHNDRSLSSDIIHAFFVIRTNAQNLLQELVVESNEDASDVQEIDCLPPLSTFEEDMTPPPPIAGCKRTLESIRGSEGSEADKTNTGAVLDSRPSKRLRSFNSPSISTQGMRSTTETQSIQAQCSLSFDSTEEIPMSHAKGLPPSTMSTEDAVAGVSTPSRKRRLSDASLVERPKRPRGMDHGPRRQTVSDPLPSMYGAAPPGLLFSEDWLNAALGSSSATDTRDLEPSALLGMGFYDHCPVTHLHNRNSVSPACEFDVSNADLASGVADPFDLSYLCITATSQPAIGQSEGSEQPTFTNFDEPFDLSEYQSVSDSLLDWGQFDDIVRSLGSCSPTPSLTSLSSDSSASSTTNPLCRDSSLEIGYPPESELIGSLSPCLSDLSNNLPSLSLSSKHAF
ncbi:hypothetical protein DENSPDRAFT_833181 [Dentipellis sp. KUC8613]|nr:hypothetical protein DENSPDRAFT_833181 [Dentipellis sp. KUC8613]